MTAAEIEPTERLRSERAQITQRQLRNDSGAILRAVEAGETFIITNNGRPVAEIRPIPVDPYAGLRVTRARPGKRFADLRPEIGDPNVSGLDILLELRGDR